jgi:AI-2 transport protein TqsA
VLDVISLLIIGVPLALTWGVLAFVTNYIPNIGFVIGLVPPALIALLDGGVGSMIAVIVVYVVLNVVVQTIIQPRFTGDAVGISATVAFISLIFWAYVLGGLGALLAIPATLFLKSTLVDNSVPASWVNALVSAEPGKDQPKPPRRRSTTR